MTQLEVPSAGGSSNVVARIRSHSSLPAKTTRTTVAFRYATFAVSATQLREPLVVLHIFISSALDVQQHVVSQAIQHQHVQVA